MATKTNYEISIKHPGAEGVSEALGVSKERQVEISTAVSKATFGFNSEADALAEVSKIAKSPEELVVITYCVIFAFGNPAMQEFKRMQMAASTGGGKHKAPPVPSKSRR